MAAAFDASGISRTAGTPGTHGAARTDPVGRTAACVLAPRHRRVGTGVRRLRREDGNTIVEFVVLSAALLIPTLYLVLTLGSVQAAVFAADTIARDSARIHAVETDPQRAAERTHRHAAMLLEDYRLAAGDVVQISCSEDPCATAGGTVTAQVRIPVPVPGLGPILGDTGPVTVGSAHAVQVDQYGAGIR